MEDQIIHQFARGQNEAICVRFREYKKRHYIDLRIFFHPDGVEEWTPTKKGITLGLEHLPELKKAIAMLEKSIEQTALS